MVFAGAGGELEKALGSANAPGVGARLKSGRVAIAGLGGLGSNLAVMLARSGVGRLRLVDFDRVEPGNLNRQHYDLTHLGLLKTEALKSQLDKINPFVEAETLAVKVTGHNAREIFEGWPIVCEALDDPGGKAGLVDALLASDGDKNWKIVAASGLAGLGSANKIRTRKMFKNLYVCGDSEAGTGAGFMAPRVMVCAGHQANMALRLLLNIEEE